MSRIDKDRVKELQPKRLLSCKTKLEDMGIDIVYEDETVLEFIYKDHKVTFWPYSGWHSGKSIKDGRGFSKLLRQLI